MNTECVGEGEAWKHAPLLRHLSSWGPGQRLRRFRDDKLRGGRGTTGQPLRSHHPLPLSSRFGREAETGTHAPEASRRGQSAEDRCSTSAIGVHGSRTRASARSGMTNVRRYGAGGAAASLRHQPLRLSSRFGREAKTGTREHRSEPERAGRNASASPPPPEFMGPGLALPHHPG
jgi:hypothetical protein